MTEEEWLTGTDPTSMWWFNEDQTTPRKLRLVACACCRRIWDQLTESRSKDAVVWAEAFADGLISREAAETYLLAGVRNDEPITDGIDQYSISRSALIQSSHVIRAVPRFVTAFVESKGGHRREEERVQAHLLRDIFGNPFRPVTFDPAWRTEAAVGVAKAIYADRTFDNLPILADALQDAGCDHPDILTHLRGPGPHVRGCWALDLVLGKE